MDGKNSKTLILQSSFDEIDKLEPYLKKIQQKAGFGEDQFSIIRLALNEAVTNAIFHGNNEDASKKVRIDTFFGDDRLQISVQDEGPGFDPAALPDPLENDNLLKESGRGIFLIKQYADELNVSQNPATLTMTFILADSEA